jgi:hypothetical protein
VERLAMEEVRPEQLYVHSTLRGEYTIREIHDGDLYLIQPMTLIILWLPDLVPTGEFWYEQGERISRCCKAVSPLNGHIIGTRVQNHVLWLSIAEVMIDPRQ